MSVLSRRSALRWGWRTRSRVTPSSLLSSARVAGSRPSRPYLRTKTCRSRADISPNDSLRGSADRSWLSGRTTFPAVASPALPDEPPDDDDHLREGYPEVDHPSSPLRAPHQLLVGVVPRARPLHYPALRCLKRGWLSLLRDLCEQSMLL